jgi:pilus assembly protein Flp/PilA
MKRIIVDFCREESGAQVVEYALVIALVAIGLALALKTAFSSGLAFDTLVARISNCFSSTATGC